MLIYLSISLFTDIILLFINLKKKKLYKKYFTLIFIFKVFKCCGFMLYGKKNPADSSSLKLTGL